MNDLCRMLTKLGLHVEEGERDRTYEMAPAGDDEAAEIALSDVFPATNVFDRFRLRASLFFAFGGKGVTARTAAGLMAASLKTAAEQLDDFAGGRRVRDDRDAKALRLAQEALAMLSPLDGHVYGVTGRLEALVALLTPAKVTP